MTLKALAVDGPLRGEICPFPGAGGPFYYIPAGAGIEQSSMYYVTRLDVSPRDGETADGLAVATVNREPKARDIRLMREIAAFVAGEMRKEPGNDSIPAPALT